MKIGTGMRRALSLLLTLCLLLSFSPVAFAAETAEEPADASAQLLERVSALESAAAEEELEYEGYLVKLRDDLAGEIMFTRAADATIEAVGETLYTVDSAGEALEYFTPDEIEYLEPNYAVYALGGEDADAFGVNDPYYEKYQWNLGVLNVPAVWDMGLEGAALADGDPVIIAVIDSGINYDHEDLDRSHILVEDGYSWVTTDKTDVKDTLGHGTFCSAQIMAGKDNGLGIAGIAPEVYILPLRVFGSSGKGYTSDIVAAINYAANYTTAEGRHVDVISMSLGGEGSSATQKAACEAAVEAGILVVAAAGNDGDSTPNYPAAFDCVIGVGSVGTAASQTEVSDFSQRGTTNVFVTAPGYQIVSAYYDSNSSYYRGNGTSFACPEVAALGAILKSVNRGVTQDQFKQLLIDTSTDLGTAGRDADYGYGLVNFEAAVNAALGQFGGVATEGTVTVSVVDADGAAIKGAKITITAQDGTAATPNDDGSYTLAAGQYDYSISAPYYVTATGSFSVFTATRSLRVTLEGEPYPVRITPVNTAGDVLGAASITVRSAKGVRQEADGFGSYTLPIGRYTYSISCTGYYTQTGSFTVEPETGATVEVTVYGDIDVASATLAVQNTDGEAVEGVTVTIYNADGGVVTPYDDGYYKFYPGIYSFVAESGSYLTEEGSFEITEAQKGTIIAVPIVMQNPLMWVYFQVVPISAAVTLRDAAGETVEPKAAGEYRLLKGTYTYTVSADGYETVTDSFTLTTAGRTIDIELAESSADGTASVTFVSNGGSAVASRRAKLGDKLEAPEAPTRKGYDFAGWYKEPSLTTPWVFDTDVVTGPTSLYAKWTAAEYRIIYMFNGAELSGLAPASRRYGEAVRSLPVPVIEGWHFNGWYADAELTQSVTFISAAKAGDTVLYADCETDTGEYTVHFESNGGSDVADVALTAETGYILTAPEAPTRTGYTFAGWYADEALTAAWDFSKSVTWHMTLYAKWTANCYSITYMSGETALSGLEPDHYIYDSAVMTLPVPAGGAGQVFSGWYSDAALTVRVRSLPAGTIGDQTLYAKWTDSIVTVPDDCDYEKGKYETDYDGDGYPDVSEDGYTLIYTQSQLERVIASERGTSDEIRKKQAAGERPKYRLAQSIMLEGEWALEKAGNFFYADFDGAGHTIAGLALSSTETGQGLFGNTYYCNIRNLTLGGSVTGGSFTGAFSGESYDTRFENLVNYASVTSTGTSVGGIVARAVGCEVYECLNFGSVTCTGTITSPTCIRAVGGIVGNSGDGTSSSGLTIDRCANFGEICNGSGTPTGGILGYAQNASVSVTNCYNRGNVTQTGTDASKHLYGTAAGIVGLFLAKGTVANCYSTGVVTSAKTANFVGGGAYQYLSAAIAFYQQQSVPATTKNNFFLTDGNASGVSIGRIDVLSERDYVGCYVLSSDGGFGYDASFSYAEVLDGLGEAYAADSTGSANGGYPAFPWQLSSTRTVTVKVYNAATNEAMDPADYTVTVPDADSNGAVRPGFHNFTVAPAGEMVDYFAAESGSFYAANDDVTIYVYLEPVTHTLTMTVRPADAALELTHPALGTITPAKTQTGETETVYTFVLPSSVAAGGNYSWSVSRYGYDTQTGSADALRDAEETVVLIEDAGNKSVYFDISPAEANAAVTVRAADGTVILPRSSRTWHLTAGTYTYEITAEGYYAVTGELTVPDAGPTVSVTLEENTGWKGGVDTDWYDAALTEYHLRTAEELAGLSKLVKDNKVTFADKTIYLDADIDLRSLAWTPIGNTTTYFQGTFDGQGHTIRGLNVSGRQYRGLFGAIKCAELRSFTVYGTVSATSTYAGGVVGYVYGGTIRDVVSHVDVSTTYYHTGGIVGGVGSSGGPFTMERCANYGSVTAKTSSDFTGVLSYAIGGLIGSVSRSGTVNTVTISACANYGDVSGNIQSVGGIVGTLYTSSSTQYGAVSDCLNAGRVTATAEVGNAGGIVGSFRSSETTVSRCLNLGTVTNSASGAEESVAGAITGASGDYSSFDTCFYLKSSAKVAVGGNDETDGCSAIGSDAYAETVETLGDAFRLNAEGEPALRWMIADSVFPVQFNISYDTDANCADDYSVAYVLRSTGGGLGEEYLVSGSGSVSLPRGSYHCIVSRVGYHVAEVTFTVQGSALEVPVELKAQTYSLTVTYAPDTAALTLQNAAGETVAPVSSENGSASYALVNGSYTLSAALYGYAAQTEPLEIAFEDTEKTIELQKLPTHTVTFEPQTESGDAVTGAELSLYQNGTLLLRTQKLTHTLPEGDYTYALRASGFATARGSFTVNGDKTVTVKLSVKQSGSAAADTDWYYDDPEADGYTLRSAEDLRGLAELVNENGLSFAGKTIALAADVDLSGAAWTPIGSWSGARFCGAFNGGGHTVTIENGEMGGTEGCFGLFGYLEGAAVSDLTLRGSVRVTVRNSGTDATIIYIGALAGYASDGSTISRVSNQMTMQADATVGAGGVIDIGGIVGWCGGVAIDACANIGAITASCTSLGLGDISVALVNAGGIAGLANAGTALRITNCYNTGSVTANGGTTKAAGILAAFSSYASGNAMYRCYNAGTLSAQTVQAIRGVSTSAMTMKDNFYLTGTDSTYGTPKTDAEMRAADFAEALGDAYRAEEGRYPILAWERSVTAVEVETMPAKTEYGDLEDFDDTGLTLRVSYGESSEVVSSGWLVLNGEALRVDRAGAEKQSDGVYTVPVTVSFHGVEVEVPVTVRQQTHLIMAEELPLAIPQPVPGAQAETVTVETEKYSGAVTWLYEGDAFTGTFEYGKFYRAQVVLNAVNQEGKIYYAFDAEAVPSADGVLALRSKRLTDQNTALSVQLAYPAAGVESSPVNQMSLHLFYVGESSGQYEYSELLDKTFTVGTADASQSWTLRELEERMLLGEGVEAGYTRYDGASRMTEKLVGISLYTLCCEAGFAADLADESVVTVGGKALTWGELRARGAAYDAAGNATAEELPALLAVSAGGRLLTGELLRVAIPQRAAGDENAAAWCSRIDSVTLTKEVRLARRTLRFEIGGPADCAVSITDEYGNPVTAEADGSFLLCVGHSYRYRVSAAGYASRSGTTGEIFGDLTVTLSLEKTWDGSYKEPILEDGYYLIYTAEELMWFNRNGKNGDCVRLMADIALNGEDELVNQWKPMFAAGLSREGSFDGVFDGNGHTIENLYIRLENLYTIEIAWDGSPMLMSDRIDVAGMFGYFTGTVKDLAVTGRYEIIDRPVSQMADWFMLGGIAAFMDGGTITGCSTDIDLVYNIGGETTSTGGYPDGGFPEACDVYIGGIAASMTNGAVISDCYATGDLSGFGTRTVNIGGIAGGMRKSDAAVTRCYFSGDIAAQGSSLYGGSFRSSLGGIVGDSAVMGGGGGTVEYCFALGGRIDGTDAVRSEANRIIGSGAAQLRFNAASTALRVINAELHDDENFSRSSVNGGNLEPARAVGSMTAYKAVGWSEEIWQCGTDSLPRFVWQKGEPGVAECSITVNAPEGTTVTFTGGVTDGKTTTASTVSFTVRLPAGWALDGIACANGTLSGAMGSYTVRNITGDLIITIAASVHKGDVNGDGVVDAVDAMLALRHSAGKLTLTGGRLSAADANGDGKVNSDDVSLILKQAVGLA